MHFKNFAGNEYGQDILVEIICQVRFPAIVKISSNPPADFQDIVRKAGYPEFAVDIPVSIPGMPAGVRGTQEIFQFSTIDKSWSISLSKDSLSLSCTGNYGSYKEFKNRFNSALSTLNNVYQPGYFSRIGLRYIHIANSTFLPHIHDNVEVFVPSYIFPELVSPIANDVLALQKISQFHDKQMGANITHAISNLSGNFKQIQLRNEKSYLIDIDCFYPHRIAGVNNVLNKCDELSSLRMDILHWSLTDTLRDKIRKYS